MLMCPCNFRLLEKLQKCRSWTILKTGQPWEMQADSDLDAERGKVAGEPRDDTAVSACRNQVAFILSVTEVVTAATIVCIEPTRTMVLILLCPGGPEGGHVPGGQSGTSCG